jgi:hypothetical protein
MDRSLGALSPNKKFLVAYQTSGSTDIRLNSPGQVSLWRRVYFSMSLLLNTTDLWEAQRDSTRDLKGGISNTLRYLVRRNVEE